MHSQGNAVSSEQRRRGLIDGAGPEANLEIEQLVEAWSTIAKGDLCPGWMDTKANEIGDPCPTVTLVAGEGLAWAR